MSDPVNSPDHYRWLPGDLEVIDITEGMSFCHGNVVKYVLRADHKGRPIEDLRKAAWYLDREIARREAAEPTTCADFVICGLSFPSGVTGMPYICTLDVFHDGDHATGLSVDPQPGDTLEAFTTPGYVASDEQFVRGEE